jgi:hypothetical protein
VPVRSAPVDALRESVSRFTAEAVVAELQELVVIGTPSAYPPRTARDTSRNSSVHLSGRRGLEHEIPSLDWANQS